MLSKFSPMKGSLDMLLASLYKYDSVEVYMSTITDLL